MALEKGWGINKNKWNVIKKLSNNKFINSPDPAYDGPIENYIKKLLLCCNANLQ